MTLPKDYAGQACSMARTLEVIGERWTLLILRDAFYGVRRFNDFVTHLRLPRAVLTDRLTSLAEAEVLVRIAGPGSRVEYHLTEKGVSLWPVVRSLVAWGDEHYAPLGPRRIFYHDLDGASIDSTGHCRGCHAAVPAGDTVVGPGPALPPPSADDDPITAALFRPHRLLEPLSV